MKIVETTATLELIGKDENIEANDWAPEIGFTLRPEDVNGKVLSFTMVSRLNDATGGTGSILLPSGSLYVFSGAPGITAKDANLASGVQQKILGSVAIATGDWVSQTLGAWVNKLSVDIPFWTLKTLYFAFFYTLAGAINNATGDDEIIEMVANLELNKFV